MCHNRKVKIVDGHELCDCGKDSCIPCRGGLGFCLVCRGAEASMPSHCPKVEMTQEVEGRVLAGKIDFKDGAWIKKGD